MSDAKFDPDEKLQWILHCGWKNRCPHCGEGKMFYRWLKLIGTCPVCGLNYNFAAPDDGPAFFSLCIVAFPLIFFVVWIQIAFNPPIWVHFLTSVPFMVIGCIVPLQLIKGWLVASQYVNKAQEAGTAKIWGDLHAKAENEER